MATASLASADKAILAMSSADYLNMTNPADTEPYSPLECSPVSSVFSDVWSRRPSASSTGSQSTDDDEVDECPNQNYYQPAKETQTTQNPCLEPPEALTIGACIIHLNQETLEPAVLMVRQDENYHTYQQVDHDGLWDLPRDTVSKNNSSISDAMAQIIRDQTSLSIKKVVGVLPETRRHLHQSQDIPSPASTSQEALSLDFTCAATAASLAAAHTARMARNVSISTTDCNVCDFMPASKRRDALLNWRKMARRNRADSTASRWSRYSDSSSSSASEGAASDSDESTCRLLRDETKTTTKNTITAALIIAAKKSLAQEQEQETDGALYMKIPPKSERNSRKTSPTRLRVKYTPLAQEPPPANIDEDSTDTTTESESDDFLSDNDGARLNQPTSMCNSRQQQVTIPNVLAILEKKHLEAIQLTYIVLATTQPNQLAETPTTTIESVLATNKALSLITATNIEAHRMEPQTRALVRQALSWASGYFYPLSPLDGDEKGTEREEEMNHFADGEDSESEMSNESDDDSTNEGALLSPPQSQ